MSLVEAALGKSRGDAAAKPAGSASGPAASAPRVDTAVAGDNSTVRTVRHHDQPALILEESLLQRAGFSSSSRMSHQLASECRRVWRKLLTESEPPIGEFSRVIMMTSALAGEGKTFAAFHLALAQARRPDWTVLLVDADVMRPRLTTAMNLTDKLGFVDAVADSSIDVESLILTTNVDGLSILPIGQDRAGAVDLYGSDALKKVLSRLSAPGNRLLVVDTLPLLQSAEALALVPCAGSVIVVVRANDTPRSALVEALGQLQEHPRVMTLLNGAEPPLLGKLIGQGYGYHYYYDYTLK